MFDAPIWLVYIACFFVVYYFARKISQGFWQKADNAVANVIICVGSLAIYACYSMSASVILLFVGTILYYYSQQEITVRAVVGPIFIAMAILFLAVVKYWNFAAQLMNINITHNYYLIGISFYVFTFIGYIVDTAYRRHEPMPKFSDVMILLSLWPHLAAGPILRIENIRQYINEKLKLDFLHFRLAAILIIGGLGKKFFLADNLGYYVNHGIATGITHMNGLEALAILLGFTGQIYFDFSGYSDMALGLAALMGFRLPANFNYPYLSTSLAEFWSRWHISLSSWFRDYLYIPLGGSRRGSMYINLLVVFMISGLWHGAALHFIMWGVIHGSLLCVEKCGMQFLEKIPKFFRWLYTFAIVTFAWGWFRLENSDAKNIAKKILQFRTYADYDINISKYLVVPLCFFLLFLFIDHKIKYYKVAEDGFVNTDISAKAYLYITVLFVGMVFFGPAKLPFIYFQF